jgi:hypothetical protein
VVSHPHLSFTTPTANITDSIGVREWEKFSCQRFRLATVGSPVDWGLLTPSKDFSNVCAINRRFHQSGCAEIKRLLLLPKESRRQQQIGSNSSPAQDEAAAGAAAMRQQHARSCQ